MTIEIFKRIRKSFKDRSNKSTLNIVEQASGLHFNNKPFSHFYVDKDISKGNWKEAETKGEDDPIVEMAAIFLGGCSIILVLSVIIIVLL